PSSRSFPVTVARPARSTSTRKSSASSMVVKDATALEPLMTRSNSDRKREKSLVANDASTAPRNAPCSTSAEHRNQFASYGSSATSRSYPRTVTSTLRPSSPCRVKVVMACPLSRNDGDHAAGLVRDDPNPLEHVLERTGLVPG